MVIQIRESSDITGITDKNRIGLVYIFYTCIRYKKKTIYKLHMHTYIHTYNTPDGVVAVRPTACVRTAVVCLLC